MTEAKVILLLEKRITELSNLLAKKRSEVKQRYQSREMKLHIAFIESTLTINKKMLDVIKRA